MIAKNHYEIKNNCQENDYVSRILMIYKTQAIAKHWKRRKKINVFLQ